MYVVLLPHGELKIMYEKGDTQLECHRIKKLALGGKPIKITGAQFEEYIVPDVPPPVLLG